MEQDCAWICVRSKASLLFNNGSHSRNCEIFSYFRHACLGQQFGLLQVKTIVSILFRNFKIEPTEKDFPEPDYTAMVVGPKNHCVVKYTKLSSSKL